MSGLNNNGSTDNVGVISTFGISLLPTSSFVHLINIKLSRNNYLLWKAQLLLYVCGQRLLGYVNSGISIPPPTIVCTVGTETSQVENPAYVQWLQQDQLVLNAILSSLSEEVLGQVLFITTSAQVWTALEGMYASSSTARN